MWMIRLASTGLHLQACIYRLASTVGTKGMGDGTGDGISDEPRLVIVNEGVMNQGYDIHDGRDNSKALNGLKVRYTNNIYAGGQMGTLFMKILGFSTEELPNAENGIMWLEMEGLTPDADGNLNPNSKTVGYVVLILTGQSVETEMFRLYEEKVRKPSIGAIKEQLGSYAYCCISSQHTKGVVHVLCNHWRRRPVERDMPMCNQQHDILN
eukprot:scaffold2388_cov57-Cyclotella_meneghiniana.AAC.4